MAEAIEARRVELGLSLRRLGEISDLTDPGIAPIRKGYRRTYTDKTRFGVARALRWEPDAIDRLLRGEQPVPVADVNETERAIYDDPMLSASAKATLVAVYRELSNLGGS